MRVSVWSSAGCLGAGLTLLLWSQPVAGDALLRIGLLLLMSTPVLRVILSIAEAVRQRDWFWMWTTVAVGVILAGTVAYSLAAGGYVGSRSP
jgi:uncharacterized membrane protein